MESQLARFWNRTTSRSPLETRVLSRLYVCLPWEKASHSRGWWFHSTRHPKSDRVCAVGLCPPCAACTPHHTNDGPQHSSPHEYAGQEISRCAHRDRREYD